MRIFYLFFLGMISTSVISCNQSKDLVNPTDGEVYEISIQFHWSSSNNPNAFGEFPGGAHFSPIIGSVHRQGAAFYRVLTPASSGVQLMAETGGTSTLSDEIDEQISRGLVYDKIVGKQASASEKIVVGTFRAKDTFRYLTLVSMIAPSPDWFIGASDINLKDDQGNWKTSISFEMSGYDAGTDSGSTFTSPNNYTSPPQPIRKFSGSDDLQFATVTIIKK